MSSSRSGVTASWVVASWVVASWVVAWWVVAWIANPGWAAGQSDVPSQAREFFAPLPKEAGRPKAPVTAKQIELGRRLYFETRLSQSGESSCNTCHHFSRFGIDDEPTSAGHDGQRRRNAPTVYNAALHVSQFWDGRAADVEEAAKTAMLGPAPTVEVLRSIPEYPPLFRAAFPDDEHPLTYDNTALALGAYQRRLLTPSRFDTYLAGDEEALTAEEVAGLEQFIDSGCITCHAGSTIGGDTYQKIGLVKPYPTDDPGRYAVTGREQDKYVFKVPSLRNVARTGPYFHDGSVETLERAIALMGEHQLGIALSPEQVTSIAAFLASLTGEIDPGFIVKP